MIVMKMMMKSMVMMMIIMMKVMAVMMSIIVWKYSAKRYTIVRNLDSKTYINLYTITIHLRQNTKSLYFYFSKFHYTHCARLNSTYQQ